MRVTHAFRPDLVVRRKAMLRHLRWWARRHGIDRGDISCGSMWGESGDSCPPVAVPIKDRGGRSPRSRKMMVCFWTSGSGSSYGTRTDSQ